MNRRAYRQMEKWVDIQVNKLKINKWTNEQMYYQTNGEMNRRAYRQMEKWVDIQMNKLKINKWTNEQMYYLTDGKMNKWQMDRRCYGQMMLWTYRQAD